MAVDASDKNVLASTEQQFDINGKIFTVLEVPQFQPIATSKTIILLSDATKSELHSV